MDNLLTFHWCVWMINEINLEIKLCTDEYKVTFTCHCPRRRRVPGAQGRMISFRRISESVRGGIFKKLHVSSSPLIGVSKLWAKSCWPPVFIIKALLEHSHDNLISFSMAAFERAELNRCDRDHMTHKVKNSYYLAFNSKSLSLPALDISENHRIRIHHD